MAQNAIMKYQHAPYWIYWTKKDDKYVYLYGYMTQTSLPYPEESHDSEIENGIWVSHGHLPKAKFENHKQIHYCPVKQQGQTIAARHGNENI